MPDLLVLELKLGSNKEFIFIIKIYNALAGSEQAGKSTKVLMNVPNIWQKHLLIMGNLNLHYTDWDNRITYPILYT